ncbi:MAG TPA: OmpH family outer membrane protein [Cytophagaceae bacterium]|nr:OmpH family outer membrane protein [Cytophagaceae bacterium]
MSKKLQTTMNKKYLLLFFNLALTLSVAIWVFVSHSKERTGYLDFERLLRQYEGMKPMSETFAAKAKVYHDNLDTLRAELSRSSEAFEKNKNKLSGSERKLQSETLEKRKYELIQYQQATEARIREEQEKMLDNITKEIRAYISDYSRKNQYSMIFFRNEQTLAYGEDANDVTDGVLKELNEKYRKGNK